MSGIFAGVDIGGTRIKIGLADETGHLLSSHVLETRGCRDGASLLDTIAGEIERQVKAVSDHVAAAGVGCPGRIDFASGQVVARSPTFGPNKDTIPEMRISPDGSHVAVWWPNGFAKPLVYALPRP